jgi:serpin B
VRIALAMAAAGARGDTATEMQAVLALPAGDAAHAELGQLLAGWAALASPALPSHPEADAQRREWAEAERERNRIILRVVNRLWAQAGYPFRDEFLTLLREGYRAPLGTVDFADDEARVTINRWVAEATEQKIAELIQDRLDPLTRLVITNAVYFKAHWMYPFNVDSTTEQPFFVAGGEPVRVPLMRQVGHVMLARLDGAMMAELPYGDGRIVMDVVLPKERDGIGRLEAAYGDGALAQWVAQLAWARVDVMLPRFRLSASFKLAEQLIAMGMPRAFTYRDADFSDIDGTRELFIGEVIHQAFVDVDEHGTEAAAATAVVMLGGGVARDRPIVFRADHPFLFFIRDTASGVVLFAGRLADPSQRA